jgi:hypothetical protein
MRVFEQVFLFRQPQLGSERAGRPARAPEQDRKGQGRGQALSLISLAKRGVAVTYYCGAIPFTVERLQGASDQ